ncbi:MAG: dihydrolipoyl dehydrogenase [Paracoccaceae bacterium]
MTDLTCDVAVIGAGTAGLTAEHHARKAGATTLLIDPLFAGTTCATVGCMPSKLLIAAADAAWSVRHADVFGIRATAETDGPAVFKRLRAERDRFAAGVKRSIDGLPDGIAIKARASFSGPGALTLDDGRKVTARAVIIATGASAAIPGPFARLGDRILTNETIFELEDLPESVGVIGAGPLGLELGQALARLGVRVEIFDQAKGIGGMRDAEVSAVLGDLIGRDAPIHADVDTSVERVKDGVRVGWAGQTAVFERLLVAAGRPPNLDALNLGSAQLELDDHGTPVFDPATMQCGTSPVFIAGDANHDRPLLHEASHEGAIAGHNAATFPSVDAARRKVPLAITFTRPEAATVGDVPDPEDTAFVAASVSYDDQGRAKVEARTGGLCRLHARRGDGRLTGASLCAPDAGHLAHLLAWSISAELSVADILELPFYHPTLEEGLRPALRDLCKKVDAPRPWSRNDDDPPGA